VPNVARAAESVAAMLDAFPDFMASKTLAMTIWDDCASVFSTSSFTSAHAPTIQALSTWNPASADSQPGFRVNTPFTCVLKVSDQMDKVSKRLNIHKQADRNDPSCADISASQDESQDYQAIVEGVPPNNFELMSIFPCFRAAESDALGKAKE
jgi:hypothetical protein